MIRRIFDLALQEKTDNQILRILRSEGILKPNGNPGAPTGSTKS